ncbi:MAG: universal stress protein, partial [Actinomycetota bacterium]
WAQALGRSGPRWSASAAQRAAAVVRAEHPGVDVVELPVAGDAARALLDSARDADLLVIGTRGHVGVVGAVRGSVSRRCVNEARVPVVLMGPDAPDLHEVRVVVTSRHGRAAGPALDWALRRALERRLPLHLLDSWHVRPGAPELSAVRRRALQLAQAKESHELALADLRVAVADRVTVTGDLVEGHGVDVEYARTHRGDLLVVEWDDADHRPSVRHSRCPVVALPAAWVAAPGLGAPAQVPAQRH